MIHITLGKYIGEPNKIKKTITNQHSLTGTLKEDCDLLNPVILIDFDPAQAVLYNYMYIQEFRRWYKINDMIVVNNSLIRINGSVDVLLSWKDNILSCSGFVSRSSSERIYNMYLEDPEFRSYTDNIYTVRSWPESDLEQSTVILILGGATGESNS